MRIVTTIRRSVAGVTFEPGQECEVDDRIGAVEVANGRARAPEKPAAPQAAPAAQAATPARAAEPAKAAEPARASTEVKPMTLAQGPNPPAKG